MNELKAYILNDDAPFAVKEGYKFLRTNIIFSLPDSGCKVIAFTSSHRSERKSSNTINTAISFAEIGYKVLLIDCDLRLPTVATRLRIKSVPGFSNLLVGANSIEQVITKLSENLDVIPAGRIPKEPTGLLTSQSMTDNLNLLRREYDYIFVDLPPVSTVADAAIVSKNIDGYLLVVRHQDSQYKEIKEALRLLRLSGANVLGFVYNDAPIAGKKSYAKNNYYAK